MRLSHTYYNERVELFDGVYDSDRERQLRTLSRLYNRHVGPITQVHLERPDLLDPAMYCGSCNHLPMASVIPDLTVRPSAGDSMSIPGGGKGAGIQQPILGAMGELAERLFAILHFQAIVDELEVGSWKEMTQRGHRALGPDEFHLFADEQYQRPGFGFVPFSEDTPLRWIRASVGQNVRLIAVDDIDFLKSDEKYTLIAWRDDAEQPREALIRMPLKELVAQLDASQFAQVHRSVVVNLRSIAHVTRGDNETADIHLKGRSDVLPVSRSFLHLFRQM